MPSGWDSKPKGILENDIVGDVYAANGTSKVIENGTNGLNGVIRGTVIGTMNGNVYGDVRAANGDVIIDSGATDDDTVIKGAIKALNDGVIIGSIASAGKSPLTLDDTVIKAFEIRPRASNYLDLYSGDSNIVMRLGYSLGSSYFKGWVAAGNLGAIIESISSPQTAPADLGDVNVQGKRLSVHSGLGWDQALYYRTAAMQDLNIQAAASVTTTLNIPTGARILGTHLHVYQALAAGDLWDAELNDGATLEALCTAQAVAVNTKFAKLYGDIKTLTDAATEVKISKNGGGNFTQQGMIKVIVYYETIRIAGNI